MLLVNSGGAFQVDNPEISKPRLHETIKAVSSIYNSANILSCMSYLIHRIESLSKPPHAWLSWLNLQYTFTKYFLKYIKRDFVVLSVKWG